MLPADLGTLRLQCLNQPCPIRGNDRLGHFGQIIHTCCLQRCWRLFSRSVLMGSHKLNPSAITRRCQFKTKFQSLHHHHHHQAALACAASTLGARGTVMLWSTMQVSAMTASGCTTSRQRCLMNGRSMPSPEARLWLGSGATPSRPPNFLQWGGNWHQPQAGHSLTCNLCCLN